MKKMIANLFLLLCVLFAMTSCDLGTDDFNRYYVPINLTSWSLPDTVTVSTPFNINLSSKTENSCQSRISFIMETKSDDFHSSDYYRLYAMALYENHGESCTDITTTKDSTISFKLTQTGKYYFYFYNENDFKKDSVLVVP